MMGKYSKTKKNVIIILCAEIASIIVCFSILLGCIFGFSGKKFQIHGEKGITAYLETSGSKTFIASNSDNSELNGNFAWSYYYTEEMPEVSFSHVKNVLTISWTPISNIKSHVFNISCENILDVDGNKNIAEFTFDFNVVDYLGDIAIDGDLTPSYSAGTSGNITNYDIMPETITSFQFVFSVSPEQGFIQINYDYGANLGKLVLRSMGVPANVYTINLTVTSYGFRSDSVTITLTIA